jgi:A/G-specific adenine glycosylase
MTEEISEESLASIFQGRLLAWYDAHARDLPWRKSRDPYRVWVSEIMLQQTRVAAVIEHYCEFLRRFPTVKKLAGAGEASVLAAWSGLGYYRRARMLHAAARVVSRKLCGKFPSTAREWLTLPGVGRYTAAAIASISLGEAVAVVDGNVERVLQRVSGQSLSGQKLWSEAEGLLDRARPGDYNQAMMELGAILCTPRVPACLTCPVVDVCATRGETARAEKSSPQKKREIHYALDYLDGAVFLVQRPRDAQLMAGMWELPEVGKGLQQPEKNPHRARHDRDELLFTTLKHSITVTDYKVYVWRMSTPSGVRGKRIEAKRLGRAALTGLARKILRRAEMI